MYYKSLFVLNEVLIDSDGRAFFTSLSIYSDRQSAEDACEKHNNESALGDGHVSRFFIDEVFSTHLEG